MRDDPSFTLSEVAAYYAAVVPRLKQQGAEWRGPCPIHEGEDDSFAVAAGSGLWKCHSQCGRGGDILALEMDLSSTTFLAAKASVFDVVGRSLESKQLRGGKSGWGRGDDWRQVAEYIYQDEAGLPLFKVVRKERGSGEDREKKFFQSRWEGGEWLPKLRDVRRVPYRLPRLATADTIYIVEGEKDVETLEAMGLVATCNPGGSGSTQLYQWWVNIFSGKQLIILVDNDQPGRKHAAGIADALLGAASIRILELPGLAEKGDVTDWAMGGGTVEALRELGTLAVPLDSDGLAALRVRWGLEEAYKAKEVHEPLARQGWHCPLRVEDIPPVWSIQAPPQRWLVDGLIPAGAVTLVTGASGVGKSMVTLAMAGAVAKGSPFAGRQCLKAPVLVLDRENPLAVVQDRLALLNISESPDFTYWGMWVDQEPAGPSDEGLKHYAIKKRPLVIVDSLVAFHTGSEQDATETRAFMQNLRRWAGQGATVIVLHHTGKGESTKDYRGSSDIPAAVDVAYVVERAEGSTGIERLTIRNFKMRMAEAAPRLAIEFRDGRFEASGDPFVLETSKARDALLDIVRRCPLIGKTLATEDLRTAARIPKRRASEIVDSAIASGELIGEKGGAGGGVRLRVASLIEVEI